MLYELICNMHELIASPRSSWSPTDSSGSPNAYPPPPPSRLRHSESYPPDARRSSFGMDRPPSYNHPHLNNRSPTDGQWRAEPQRRPARSHPDDDGYFFPRRVEYVSPPPYPNHLRDPRLHRGQPSPSQGSYSPQPHNQAHSATSMSTSRINSVRRINVSQIYSEHSYFKKGDPGIDHETSSSMCSKTCPTAESQPESQVEVLPRHMLSHIPQVFTKIMNKPASLNSKSEKAFESTESRGNTPVVIKVVVKDALAIASGSVGSKAVSEEASLKQDPTNMTLPSDVAKEPSPSTKESPCSSDEEINQLKEDELATDQTPQKQTTDSDCPDSPALSTSSFEIDLDTEPESSGASDEEEQASESDLHSDDEILQLVPTSFDLNVKSQKTGMETKVEAEPSKVSQSNSRVLRNGRVLPRSTTSVVYSTRRQPVAVVDNKVPSVRLSLSRDGTHTSALHAKVEDSLKQPRTRRSRRLATSQDATVKNLEDKAEEAATSTDNMESGEDTATEDPLLRTGAQIKQTVVSKDDRMLMSLVVARAAKAAKEKKRGRRFFSGHVKKRTLNVSLYKLI